MSTAPLPCPLVPWYINKELFQTQVFLRLLRETDTKLLWPFSSVRSTLKVTCEATGILGASTHYIVTCWTVTVCHALVYVLGINGEYNMKIPVLTDLIVGWVGEAHRKSTDTRANGKKLNKKGYTNCVCVCVSVCYTCRDVQLRHGSQKNMTKNVAFESPSGQVRGWGCGHLSLRPDAWVLGEEPRDQGCCG